jgi:hypothetical protein
MDLNLKNLENELDSSGASFDPDTGKYRNLPDKNDVRARGRSESGAGSRTLARGLVLRALLREQGEEVGSGKQRGRLGLLEELVRISQLHPQATKDIFYSRSAKLSESVRNRILAAKRQGGENSNQETAGYRVMASMLGWSSNRHRCGCLHG